MSRTYRKQPYFIFRGVRTTNELKQVKVSNDYYDEEYTPYIRKRFIPTLYDDVKVSAYYELDYHHS
jgi:hypothetical protein